jgi:hypothetical protein
VHKTALHHDYYGDCMKEYQMGRTFSTWGKERFTENLSRKIRCETTTWETKSLL